jgi:anti-anti-sigma regulatory factor/putative methionine-R-sulfoxide reductase with GAF domain
MTHRASTAGIAVGALLYLLLWIVAREAAMTQVQLRSTLYMEAIKSIVTAIAHFDALQPMLEHVVSSVQRELDFYIASIFIYEPERGHARLLAQVGQHHEPAPVGFVQPISTGVVGRVIREQATLLCNDVRQLSDYVSPDGYRPAGSELCVPIVSDLRIWGAFNVESSVPDAFTHDDQLALELIAAQLGSAIYNLDLRLAERSALTDVARQAAQLKELLSEVNRLALPIFPISRGALALPLIGNLDDERMQRACETLLATTQRTRSSLVVIDITGVAVIDTAVAHHILQLAQMLRLLGAELVLTGIRPEVAQSLVQLGSDLSTLNVRPDFAAGISYALRARR